MDAYLAQIPGDEPSPLAVESVMEAPLVDASTGEDLGISLVGITDLLLADTKGPRIVDFKTAARSSAPLEIAHEIQLTSYAYLVRHVFGRRESGLEIRSLIKTKVPQVEGTRLPATDGWPFPPVAYGNPRLPGQPRLRAIRLPPWAGLFVLRLSGRPLPPLGRIVVAW